GPRYQKTLQLVLLYSGHMRIWIDGTMREAESRSMCILLPDHEEYFAFFLAVSDRRQAILRKRSAVASGNRAWKEGECQIHLTEALLRMRKHSKWYIIEDICDYKTRNLMKPPLAYCEAR